MILYTVYENGAMRKVSKVDFSNDKVYLIDDYKTIYLWYGLKASNKKKKFGKKRANDLNSKKKKPAKIQIISKDQEHGSFLAIMDILKKGLKVVDSMEKRPELKIQFNETQELIEAGIDPDFEAEITIASHNLSQENHSYEDLCRKLAELQMSFLKGKEKVSENDLKKKTKEIYKSSSTYDELCWLIVELSKLLE